MIIPVHGARAPSSEDAKQLAGHGPDYYLNAENIKFTEAESVSQSLLSLLERMAAQDPSLEDLIGRVLLLENTLFCEMEANPFSIKFDELDGLEVMGVWNPALGRIEC